MWIKFHFDSSSETIIAQLVSIKPAGSTNRILVTVAQGSSFQTFSILKTSVDEVFLEGADLKTAIEALLT